MTFRATTAEDILASKSASAMPSEQVFANTETRHYFQAIDNLTKVFLFRPGDEVLFLTDPLLDRRVVDALSGIANSRGVQPREFMAATTQIPCCPPEARALVEKATFVISTWFCSVQRSVFHEIAKPARAALGQDHLLPQSRSSAHAPGAISSRPGRRDHPRHSSQISDRRRFRDELLVSAGERPVHQIYARHGEKPSCQQSLAGTGQSGSAGMLCAFHADAWPEHLRSQLLQICRQPPTAKCKG